MAAYKVIQDIEAEDKFVGPLTLKQFIFAGITAVCLYLSFIFIVKHVWWLMVPLLPIMLVCGFLAFPWGRDQPTEIWLLAKLRFALKSRKRIWDQSGVQELVTITAPKRDTTQYTNNLTKTEVESRLRVLAKTIDSRGWAIKNVNVNLYNPATSPFANQFSDRLIDPASLPQEVPANDVTASDDIMDPQNNPLAQHLDQMISSSSKNHRQAVMEQIDRARESPAADEPVLGMPAPNYWFINQPDPSQMPATVPANDPSSLPAVQANPGDLAPEEKALLEQLHREQAQPAAPAYGHMRVIQPLSAGSQQASNNSQPAAVPAPQAVPASKKAPVAIQPTPPAPAPAPAVTPPPDPAILELAVNNDRDVASLAREANAKMSKNPANEVVIRLR